MNSDEVEVGYQYVYMLVLSFKWSLVVWFWLGGQLALVSGIWYLS